MITLINTSSTREFGESVLFQPVLKAYPMCPSWLITAHIPIGHLEHHWKTFNRQMNRTCQLLQSLSQQPSAPTQLLAMLQLELTNINDIYISYKSIIIPAINLLDLDPSFDGNSNYNKHVRRSLLPFLGKALSWLTGIATSKDVNSIKKRVNQLTATQSTQQEAIVHIVSILNVTRYAVQVNRKHINIIMDKVDETVNDVNNLYSLTTSLATSLSYYQLLLHIRSVLANFWDSLPYIRTVSMHTMDYINAATTVTLSPHILPIRDLKQMLSHIEETLPPTMHLPVSSEDTLHFYHYLHTYILIANQQFLFLIDVPIQDHSQQLPIYKSFTLDIPHHNFTACYDVSTPHLGITQDETMAVEISHHQFSICQESNRPFWNIHAPFQPLANPPSCITILYAKNTASISTRCSLQISKTQNIIIPSQIAPNVWILTTAPSAVTTAITIMCPGEHLKYLTVKKPIHICAYHLLAMLTHQIFICHHNMNISLYQSIFFWTWQTLTWSTCHHSFFIYGNT